VGDLLLQQATLQLGTIRAFDLLQAFLSGPPQGDGAFRFEYFFNRQLLWEDETNQVFGDVAIGSNGCPQRVASNPALTPPLAMTGRIFQK
jgi:hypothetical protein